MLRASLSPEGTLSLFKKSVDEGYYDDLDKVIRTHAASYENDYLAQAAAALYAAKEKRHELRLVGDTKSAIFARQRPCCAIDRGQY